MTENLRAKAAGELPHDDLFRPTIPNSIVQLPFDEALAQIDRSCHSIQSKLDEVSDQLKTLVNQSLTVQLAASMTPGHWDEMQGFDQRLDGLIGEWADQLRPILTWFKHVGSTLGLYNQALGYMVGKEDEPATQHQAYVMCIEANRLILRYDRRQAGHHFDH